MSPALVDVGGLPAIVENSAPAGDGRGARDIVVLHGRDMEAAHLAPFARSIGVAARFVFPEAPLASPRGGRRWWIDPEDAAARAAARAALGGLLRALAPAPILVGFSQGGMLATDYALHADAAARPAGLALLSSQRIADAAWEPRLTHLAALPVFVSHGRADPELPFARGERLRDAAIAGGADVTWLPFEGGHEIPLVAWRALRRWLAARL